MPYNIVVCAKQVPDTKNVTGDAMKEDGTINRGALPAIFNPEDLNALEAALALRDEHGGTVTAVTMGAPMACELLRECLFRGVDRAVLVTDRRAAGSDTLATSYILSCAVRKLKADIVLCGRQAIDGDTAQVGPQLAEKLDLPLVTYVEEFMGITDGRIEVRRNVGNGWEVVSAPVPILMTVMESANVPRPPAAKKIMKYKKALSPAELAGKVKADLPDADDATVSAELEARRGRLADRGLLIEQWTLDDIDADLDWCGLRNSPTNVNRVQSIVLTGGEYHEYEPTDQGIARLLGELIEDHTIG
jgi:electron transfer flavoprotein beta subunit